MQNIDRVSSRVSLVQRYLSQRAGGAYNVKEVIDSSQDSNKISLGDASIYDKKYTITEGFKIGQKTTELKEASQNTSLELSQHMVGFINKKYYIPGKPKF